MLKFTFQTFPNRTSVCYAFLPHLDLHHKSETLTNLTTSPPQNDLANDTAMEVGAVGQKEEKHRDQVQAHIDSACLSRVRIPRKREEIMLTAVPLEFGRGPWWLWARKMFCSGLDDGDSVEVGADPRDNRLLFLFPFLSTWGSLGS